MALKTLLSYSARRECMEACGVAHTTSTPWERPLLSSISWVTEQCSSVWAQLARCAWLDILQHDVALSSTHIRLDLMPALPGIVWCGLALGSSACKALALNF